MAHLHPFLADTQTETQTPRRKTNRRARHNTWLPTEGGELSAYCRGKGVNVTSAGWQVTLRDPTWHVSSRSGVAVRLVANCYTLLTYLLLFLLED